MGWPARWLKGIFGTRKDKEGSSRCPGSLGDEKAVKRRWTFGRSSKEERVAAGVPFASYPAADPRWLRSYIAETEKEQSKHAIAVATATAAAADMAVAAAQAAVAVVRLTSQGPGGVFAGSGCERWAAARIQAIFRGFLARKALRALKGLVKLQALVRGYLVRKRAAATLQSMQALIRAQMTAARSRRARCSFNKENKHRISNWPRRSVERIDDTRSDFHRKRISTSYEPPPLASSNFDESPKIVEIDTYKPRTRSHRLNRNMLVELGEDYPYHVVSSPLPCPLPAHLSIPECRYPCDSEWGCTGDKFRFTTAHNTPRFSSGSGRCPAPATPPKNICGDGFCRAYPNYMVNTQSFDAKLRSHSAPKQRPEPGGFKKRLSLNEFMASRPSISWARIQQSCSNNQKKP